MATPVTSRTWHQTPWPLLAALCALALLWRLLLGNPIENLEMRGFDWLLRWRADHGVSPPAAAAIQLITLDDEDLQELPGYEQEYAAVGQVIHEAAALGARVVAVDAIFQRGTPEMIRPIAEALQSTPAPVLAELWTSGTDPQIAPQRIQSKVNIAHQRVGLVTVEADRDGVYRRYAFLHEQAGQRQPSLALAAFLAWRGAAHETFAGNGTVTWEEEGLETKTLSRQFATSIPQAPLLNPRAPWWAVAGARNGGFTWSNFHRFHQFHQQFADRKLKPLADSIVLIGYSASGLGDFGATSLGGYQPKVLLHATALSDLIQDLSIRRAPAGTDALGIGLLFLLGCGLFRCRGKIVLIGLWLLGLLLVLAAGGELLLRHHLLISSVSLAVLWGAALVVELVRRHTVELVARLKLRTTMSYYFSRRVLEHVLSHPACMEPQEAEMTVLLTDIRNFTPLTEKLGARAIFDLLNRVFEIETRAVLQEEGSMEHFLGDQFLAYWGAPEPQPDSTDRAVRAAAKIQRDLEELRQSLPPEIRVLFGFGVAVHRGRGLFGNKGSLQRLDFGLLGDFINEAARVESLTKYYGIPCLLTGPAYRSISNPPPSRLVDRVRVKGKSQPVELFEIQHPGSPSDFEQRSRRYTEAFALYAAGDFAAAGHQFGQLAGELNDGPSRLLAERCDKLAAARPADWNGIFSFESK